VGISLSSFGGFQNFHEWLFTVILDDAMNYEGLSIPNAIQSVYFFDEVDQLSAVFDPDFQNCIIPPEEAVEFRYLMKFFNNLGRRQVLLSLC